MYLYLSLVISSYESVSVKSDVRFGLGYGLFPKLPWTDNLKQKYDMALQGD